MKRYQVYLIFFYTIITLNAYKLAGDSPATVQGWYKASRSYHPLEAKTSITSYAEFIQYLKKYSANQKKFLASSAWLDNKAVDLSDEKLKQFFYTHYMRPFTLKCATQPGAQIYFWGDLHGDIQALSESLYKLYTDKIISDDFKIIKPDSYFFFLGDTVDRGQHGPDTLTLLWIFALANPSKVFLIRGNHEDLEMNQQPYYESNSGLQHFYKQLSALYATRTKNDSDDFIETLDMVLFYYNLLPVASFVGCNNSYLQCCHGGLEPRYNPKRLLATFNTLCLQAIERLSLAQDELDLTALQVKPECASYFKALDLNDMTPFKLGFLWNDFNANTTDQEITSCLDGRGVVIGRALAEKIFAHYSDLGDVRVKGIIRAHQHNHTMPGVINRQNCGVFSLWDNQVITTIATSMFTKSTSFIKLTVAKKFNDWNLKSFNFDTVTSVWKERENSLKNWRNIKN